MRLDRGGHAGFLGAGMGGETRLLRGVCGALSRQGPGHDGVLLPEPLFRTNHSFERGGGQAFRLSTGRAGNLSAQAAPQVSGEPAEGVGGFAPSVLFTYVRCASLRADGGGRRLLGTEKGRFAGLLPTAVCGAELQDCVGRRLYRKTFCLAGILFRRKRLGGSRNKRIFIADAVAAEFFGQQACG